MTTILITKQTGAGHYKVIVIQNYVELGNFETTDMNLVADIEEIDNGFESNLYDFETFQEVEQYCINKVS